MYVSLNTAALHSAGGGSDMTLLSSVVTLRAHACTGVFQVALNAACLRASATCWVARQHAMCVAQHVFRSSRAQTLP
jgi:hypothetical protein